MADAGPCGAPRPRKVDVEALWRDLKARTAVGRGDGGGGSGAKASLSPKAEHEATPPPTKLPAAASSPPLTTTATTLNDLLERLSHASRPRERLAALEALAAAATSDKGWPSWSEGARPLDGGACSGRTRAPSSRRALEVAKALVRRAVDDASEAMRERAADLLAEMMMMTRTTTTTARRPDDDESDDDDETDDNASADAPSPPPPNRRDTTTTTAAPSSCPVLRIAPLTDAQARELVPYLLPPLAERLLAERPRYGAFEPRGSGRGAAPAAAAAAAAANTTSSTTNPPATVAAAAAPTHEPSEEVRLALLRAFTATVQRFGGGGGVRANDAPALLARHAPLCLAVVQRAASARPRHGNGPASHLAACELSRALERALGACLQPLAILLARALVPLTAWPRRAAVRAAAVRALAPLAHRGAHEAALMLIGHRDPHVVPIRALVAKVTTSRGDGDGDDEDDEDEEAADTATNFCGRLAADPSPAVRLAFVEALLRDWLTRLPGRRDHEARLVPFVLGAMVPHFAGEVDVDCCGSGSGSGGGGGGVGNGVVATAAAALLEDLGAQHERDLAHEGTLYEEDDDDDDDDEDHPCSTGCVAYAGGGGSPRSVVSPRPPPLLLPGPFARRPSRGARALARAVLGGMVGAACSELAGAWQPGVRWRAAALVAVTLVVAEKGADRHLPALVPTLCKAAMAAGGGGGNGGDDESAAAARWSRRCCEVLGVFCDGESLWSLLHPFCCCCCGGSSSRQAAAVRVLASVVRGAKAAAAASSGERRQQPPLLAQRALEMVANELKDARNVGLCAAVRELEREAGGSGG